MSDLAICRRPDHAIFTARIMFHESDQPARQLEKYSAAVSLSDMEIFVFPELLFSLVLANTMSPRVWAWREDPWFAKIEKMSPYKRVQRLKQFIMDHYEFNLDLDTWGLTTKTKEIDRFREFIDLDILERSNALFGYEGDKYYFDLDIRRHFGLDKYTSDVIPYWKTETVEAMDAFAHKEGYRMGAGECVSLSTLYAAALYVVCGIPFEDIFLIATPLHSQNFVRVKDGVITNNRRIVTKNMWYNGTELTDKAQRAIRNEQVTIVANNTGYVHTMYPVATMDREDYETFEGSLRRYLRSTVDMDILVNFLRQDPVLKTCFQIKQPYHGKFRYIEAEKVYAAEHTSRFRVNLDTVEKLLDEIDEYAFYTDPIPGRIILGRLDNFFKANPNIDLNRRADLDKLLAEFACTCGDTIEISRKLLEFVQIEPRLPHPGKTFLPSQNIDIEVGLSREEVIAKVASLRETHPVADLAFYAYRDLSQTAWDPFLKAAFERNPACVDASRDNSIEEIVALVDAMPNASVYDGPRLAQPDETWNFSRGDAAERAILLANILTARGVENVRFEIKPDEAVVEWESGRWSGPSKKGLAYA